MIKVIILVCLASVPKPDCSIELPGTVPSEIACMRNGMFAAAGEVEPGMYIKVQCRRSRIWEGSVG